MRNILFLLAFCSFSVAAFQAPDQTTVYTGTVDPHGRVLLPLGQVDFASWSSGTLVNISASSDGAGTSNTTNTFLMNPPTTLTADTCFDNGGSDNGALRYTCATSKYFHIAFSISLKVTAGGDFVITPAVINSSGSPAPVNNGVVNGCKAYITFPNNSVRSTAFHCILVLNQNDVLSLRVGNIGSTDSITIRAMNIQAVGM